MAKSVHTELKNEGSIVVGSYRITQTRYNQYWIGEKDGGEGGMFTEAQLLPYIKEFYHDNF